MTSNQSKKADPSMQTKQSKLQKVKLVLIRCYFRVFSPSEKKNMKGNLPLWCSCAMLTPEKCYRFFILKKKKFHQRKRKRLIPAWKAGYSRWL